MADERECRWKHVAELPATPRIDAAVSFEDVPERFRRAENLLCPSLVNQPGRGHGSNNLDAGLGREVLEAIHLSQRRGTRAPKDRT